MQQLKIWIVIEQSTNLELNEPVLEVGMNVKELSHSQAPKPHKKESTHRLNMRIRMLWAPKGLSFTGLRTQLKSSARHTLSNQQAQVKLRDTC